MNDSNDRDRPGSGVAFWQPQDQRRSEKAPDFKGYIVLDMDYKAGEKFKLVAWKRSTQNGLPFLTLKEDNWTKRKEMGLVKPDVEVEYKAPTRRQAPKKDVWDDDNEVPF